MTNPNLGRQFSNYSVQHLDGRDPDDGGKMVEAVHGTSGKRLGFLSYGTSGRKYDPVTESLVPVIPEIKHVEVHGRYRRKGIASAMLAAAREKEPTLRHSTTSLSGNGRAWSKARP